MSVAGIDGCKGGWIAVRLEHGAFAEARFFPAFSAALEAWREVDVVAVDMPIGLAETGPRQADIAARALLKGAASTLFTMPPRAVFDEPSYEQALASARRMGGGLTKQAFALRDKVLEVEICAMSDDRVREVHPEVCFRAMTTGPLLYRKKSWNGMNERIRRLRDVDILLPEDLQEAGRAGIDDVLDATAAAWTAQRISDGAAKTLPSPPPDGHGRRLTIWY